MSRMTPSQEAEYAFSYGTPREKLSPKAQVIYDQLKAGQAEREPVSVADNEAASRVVIQDAQRAFDDGRRVFLCRVPMMYDRLVALGTAGLPGPSSVIEAIENLGWRLDQMSWVPRPVSAFRAEGIFLFRRVTG
jgi:hypothetical protein